jgi:hypothetical protein
MPIHNLVTFIDRWVTRRRPGRSTTEDAQPTVVNNTQQQCQQQNPHIHRTTQQDKESQQLTLQKPNLDLHGREDMATS